VPTNQFPTVINETRKVIEHERITESKERGGGGGEGKDKVFFYLYDSLITFDKHLNHTRVAQSQQ